MTASKSSTERFNAVVIGAGQSGLATAYYLAQGETDFVVLDAAPRVGHSWRSRWDSLRLFTPAMWNNLPGMPFPAEDKTYLPTKDEAADYLEKYAEKFELPVRLGVEVKGLKKNGESYVIDTGKQQIEANHVVVATGPFQRPRTPSFASELDSSITQLHSSEYQNPSQLEDGDTLVVGAASSGCEIAVELVKDRKVYLAGREVEGISKAKVKTVGRLIVPWLYSKPRDTIIGKKLFQKARSEGHPLIGFTDKDVRRTGVERVPRVKGVRDGKPELEDGRTLDVKNVVWGTGYDIDFSWIDLPIFGEDGYPRHHRGVVEGESGLYFMGLIFLHTLSSQLFMGVARDAKYVSDELLSRSASNGSAANEPAYEAESSSA